MDLVRPESYEDEVYKEAPGPYQIADSRNACGAIFVVDLMQRRQSISGPGLGAAEALIAESDLGQAGSGKKGKGGPFEGTRP